MNAERQSHAFTFIRIGDATKGMGARTDGIALKYFKADWNDASGSVDVICWRGINENG